MTLPKTSLSMLALIAIVFAAPVGSQAATVAYSANLSGTSESPPNASPGTGFATVTVNDVTKLMAVHAEFSGLLGATTAAHIHCCFFTGLNAVVATQTPSFIGFPLGVTSGTFDATFDMNLASSYRPGFITDSGGTVAQAFAVFLLGLNSGTAYFNIHSSVFTGGEIRGNLQAVPLPAALPLFATILAGGGLIAWRRKRKAVGASIN